MGLQELVWELSKFSSQEDSLWPWLWINFSSQDSLLISCLCRFQSFLILTPNSCRIFSQAEFWFPGAGLSWDICEKIEWKKKYIHSSAFQNGDTSPYQLEVEGSCQIKVCPVVPGDITGVVGTCPLWLTPGHHICSHSSTMSLLSTESRIVPGTTGQG